MERDATRQRARDLDQFWDALLDDPSTTTAPPAHLGDVRARVLRALSAPIASPELAAAQERVWRRLLRSQVRTTGKDEPMPTPLTLSPNGHVSFLTAPPRGWQLGPRQSPRTWIQPALAVLLIAALLAAYFTVIRRDEPATFVPAVATPAGDDATPGGWPMYRGNPGRTGETSGPAVTGPPAILWQFAAGADSAIPPAISGGVVYLPTDGDAFYALDAATGRVNWQTAGNFAMPSASADTLFFDAPDDVLVARDLTTGQTLWQATPGNRFWTPLVDSGTVYYPSEGNLIVARDARTGEERWVSEQTAVASRSAALADGILVAGSDGHHVYGVDQATGKTRWQYALGGDGATIQTPAIANGIAYAGTFGGGQNTFVALDLQTGAERWRLDGTDEDSFGAAGVADGLVFVPSDSGALRALDAATGELRWTYTSSQAIASAPAIADGIVYASTASGGNGVVVAMDAATGSERWQMPLDGLLNYGPALADGRLYAGTTVGNVYAIGSASDLPPGATPAVTTPSAMAQATPAANAVGESASATPTAATLTTEWILSKEDGAFAGALSALEIDPFGRLWTCNLADGSIQILDRDGNQLARVTGGLGSGPDEWNWHTDSPDGGSYEGCGIAFAPDGTTYITDGGNGRVKELDPSGKLIDTWSTADPEDGRLHGPVGIARLADGTFLVIDWGIRTTTRRFSADGELLGDFDPGEGFDVSSFDAISAQEDAAGNLWFVELGPSRVVTFAPDGSLLLTIGDAPGSGPGQFNLPTDLTLDENGAISVADNGNKRLQVFAPDGTFLAQFTGEEAGIPRFGSEGGSIASVESGGNGYLYVTDYARDDLLNGDQRLIKFRITLPGEP